jgi:Domain of unknown function (DUF303).
MMKLSLSLLLGFSVLLPSVADSAPLPVAPEGAARNNQVVDLFFVGGQSNATTNFYAGIRSVLLASGQFPGCEVVWKQHSGNPIHNWFDGSRRTNYLVDLYDPSAAEGALEAACNNLIKSGKKYRLRGFFWFQGEGDTHNTNEVNAYTAKFTGMLNQLATDLNDGRPVPFAIALIGYNTNRPPMPPHVPLDQRGPVQALRTVQRNLAVQSSIGSYADSWDYPRVDTWHITAKGAFDFGSALAKAFLAQQNGVTNPVPNRSAASAH